MRPRPVTVLGVLLAAAGSAMLVFALTFQPHPVSPLAKSDAHKIAVLQAENRRLRAADAATQAAVAANEAQIAQNQADIAALTMQIRALGQVPIVNPAPRAAPSTGAPASTTTTAAPGRGNTGCARPVGPLCPLG